MPILKQKHILLLFVIGSVLLLGFLATVFLSSQNSVSPTDSTSDHQPDKNDAEIDGLQLYRNEEWGFKFQYPKDWQIRQPAFGSAVSKFNMDVEPLFPHLPHPITINILPNDWIERVQKNFESRDIAPSEIQVGGIEGLGYEHTSEGLSQIDYLFPRGEYWIVVGGKKQYKDVLDGVITTFKFLK